MTTKKTAQSHDHPAPSFNRQAYLKQVRQTILRNLGLPEDTRPSQVARLLEIRQKIKEKV